MKVGRHLALDLHKEYIYGYHEAPDGKARRFRCVNGREQWKDLARAHTMPLRTLGVTPGLSQRARTDEPKV